MKCTKVVLASLALSSLITQVPFSYAAQAGEKNNGSMALIGGAPLAAACVGAYWFFSRTDSGKRMMMRIHRYFCPRQFATKFFLAVMHNDFPTVRGMLESNAAHVYVHYDSMLISFARAQNDGLVECIMCDQNVFLQNRFGLLKSLPQMALHMTKDPEMAELLLDAGATSNVNSGEVTPLHTAVGECPSLPVAHLLIQRGFNVNSIAPGYTPLHMIGPHSDPDMVRFLYSAGADMHASACNGATALHRALQRAVLSRNNRVHENVQTLLEYGVEVDGVDSRVSTPLSTILADLQRTLAGGAWSHELRVETVRSLVEYGAAVTPRIEDLLAPVDLANVSGYGYERRLRYNEQMSRFRNEVAKAKNIQAWQQAHAYLDQNEYVCGQLVPTDIQNIIRDMVLDNEQVARLERMQRGPSFRQALAALRDYAQARGERLPVNVQRAVEGMILG